MKKKFTEAQIAFALRQAESGPRVPEVCRKTGISEQMFYRKKSLDGFVFPQQRRDSCVVSKAIHTLREALGV